VSQKVIFFNVPTSGHVNPSLPLTRELVRRGVHVITYLTEGYRQKIEGTGAEFRLYPAPVNDHLFDGLDGSNPPETARRLVTTTYALLPWIKTVLAAEQPGLVLYDSMCPWGRVSAEMAGLPHVSSMSLLLFTPGMLMRSGLLPEMLLLTLRSFNGIRAYQAIAGKITREFGVKLPDFASFLNMRGTITLSYTSALFQPAADTFGTGIKYVGPQIEARADNSNFPFEQLSGQPLIYISLGTVINRNVAFYRAAIEAFRDASYQVVLSIGQNTPIGELGALPANFIVRSFVPQLDVLKRAALFITHAGMNSVHEGLYYDVPLILAPQTQEQTFVAKRTADLGVGVRIDQHDAVTLRQAADKVLTTPRYREQARTVGESLRAAGGVSRAADEVIKLME